MKVVLFGATGMIGQSVLRECLVDPRVTNILSISRQPLEARADKLEQILNQDFSNFEHLAPDLSGVDACFFCLGTTSSGKDEAEYTRITYGYTLAAAETLARINPKMTFIYVSAEGADPSEKSRTMWQRVRGKTENALLQLPVKAAYIVRPAVVEPRNGIESRTKSYRLFYKYGRPLLPIVRMLVPNMVTNTDIIAKAMVNVAISGAPKRVLSTRDFKNLSRT